MTEDDWLTADCPFELLNYLDGKVDDREFIRFSVACCRCIWTLLSDPRSRAVVDATQAALETGDWSGVAAADAVWNEAYQSGDILDGTGGLTNEAIESVSGLGMGHAAQVSLACLDAVGYAAAEVLKQNGMPQTEITRAWQVAEVAQRKVQCEILRTLFVYRSVSAPKLS